MAEIDSAAFAKLTSALQGQSVALDKLTSQLGSQDREFLQTAKPITIDSVKTRQGMRPFDTAIADAVVRAQRPAEVTVEREKEESLLMKIAKGVVGVGAAVLVIKAVMDNPELKRSFNAAVKQIGDFFIGDDGIITKAFNYIGFNLLGFEDKIKDFFPEGSFLDNIATVGFELMATMFKVVEDLIFYIKNPKTLIEDIKAGAKDIFSGLIGFVAGGFGGEPGTLGRVLDILTKQDQLELVIGSIYDIGDVLAGEIQRAGTLIDPIAERLQKLVDGTNLLPESIENVKTSIIGLLDNVTEKLNEMPLIGTASKTLEKIREDLEKDPNAKLNILQKTTLGALERFAGNAAAPADLTKPIESLDTQIKTLSDAITALTNSINGMNNGNGNGNGNGEPDPTDTGSFYNPSDQNYGIEQRLMARQMA